jgi:hypothetical protein
VFPLEVVPKIPAPKKPILTPMGKIIFLAIVSHFLINLCGKVLIGRKDGTGIQILKLLIAHRIKPVPKL